MAITHITVAQFVVAVERKNIKNLCLKVYAADGRLKISVPHQVNEETIRALIIAKIAWIKKQQAKILAQQPAMQFEYVTGEVHYFAGQGYTLNVIYQAFTPKVSLHNQQLNLYVRHASTTAKRQQILNTWYRQMLKQQISALIKQWQPTLGVTVREWRVKNMQTRWGTCNSQAARIWLNLQLIKKSPQCLEYVLVHEMVHLLERRHNARFFAYLDRFLPDWRDRQQQLNQQTC